MFWRRYAHGIWPLLIWARSADAADVTAAIHTRVMPPLLAPVIWLSLDEVREIYDAQCEDDE